MRNFRPQHILYLSIVAFMSGALIACGSAPRNDNPNIQILQTPPTKQQPTAPTPAPVPTPTQVKPTPVATVTPTPVAPPQEMRHYGSFNEWKNDFINRTIAQGHASSDVYNLMNSASLNQLI